MKPHEVVFAARGALLQLTGLDSRKVRVEAVEPIGDGPDWRFAVSAARGERRRFVEIVVRAHGGVELVTDNEQ